MNDMNDIIFYRCEKCGNIVVLMQAGGGTLTCCGQGMTKLQKANSTDAAKEKHLPVVTSDNEKIKVTGFGLVADPMLEEHYIQWIALVAGNKVEIIYLKPEMEPKAEFIYYTVENEVIYTGTNDEIVPNVKEAHVILFTQIRKIMKFLFMHIAIYTDFGE